LKETREGLDFYFETKSHAQSAAWSCLELELWVEADVETS
jgi:hypothetical protein